MTDDGNPNVTYNIYKKDVKSGNKLTLGAVNMNTAVNYVVAATDYNESIVTQPTQPVTTEPVVTTPQDPSNDFIYGDLNYDSKVDAFDMVLMRQEIINNELDRDAKRRADLDANGKVEIADAIQLQKFLLTGESFTAVTEKRMFVYAVDQTYSEGVEENVNAGYRDISYVNLDNKVGSNITWKIDVPTDGNYLCTFGIANGSNDNRKMKIEVNGQKDFWVQDFLATGSWTEWQERGIVLPLKKGDNTILMTSFTEQGGPNLDYLHIEWTDEPIAQIYEESQTITPPVQSDVSRTIYIAGDSTVQTYKASYAPQQGWGAFLGDNMPQGVTVSNHAIAGRSSKSFYDNGRFDTILGTIQKNDYLLIQFGINDSASNKAERYAPTCGSVPGTTGSFEDYMAKYIEGAKSKGATPVLVTTVIGLKSYDSKTKKFVGNYQNYCNAMKQLAAYYDIPCIDLNALMVNHYNSIGYDAGVPNGSNIGIAEYSGADTQQFRLNKNGSSYYITTKASDNKSSLDIKGKSKAEGANVHQYKYQGNSNQLFEITPVNDAYSWIKGDLNFDGMVNSFDMCLMRKGVVNSFDEVMAGIADVTADGQVNGEDLRLMSDFILAKEKRFAEQYYTQILETPQPAEGIRKMEYLNRGVSAVSTGNSVFVSWRLLADDDENVAFNVYRTTDNKTIKLNDAPLSGGTNYTDKSADLNKNNTYSVKAVVNRREYETDDSETLVANAAAQCKILNINQGGKIHFVWVGDFDGDGEYDYLVDRNADEHQKLEAYRSDGTYLWTIDLGYNSENKKQYYSRGIYD